MTLNREVARIAARPQKVRRPHVYPLVMNGDMRIAQRGTSATGVGASNSYVTVDRFRHNFANTAGRLTSTQSTDVPDGQGFKHSLKLDCTTADTSIAANEFGQIYQSFEGQDLGLINKGTADCSTFTVAFWAKGTAKTYACELYDSDNNRQITKLFTVSTSWTKHIINFPADTSTDDNFTYDNNQSFMINFGIHMGSDYTSGTLNTSSWANQVAANRYAGINSFFDSTDNELYITGLQLELGTFNESTIPEFQFVDQATQLMQCQRYAQVFVNGNAQSMGYGACYQADAVFVDLHFKNVMRATPTAEVTTSTNYWAINSGGTTDTFDSWSGVSSQTHQNGGMLFCDGNNLSVTKGHTGDVYSNNAAAKIVISADL